MKILLIKPPVRDFYQTSIRTHPAGLAYIAASLKSKGYEAEILDCQIDKKQMISLPSEFSYLREFYPVDDKSPFKLFGSYYHFGMSWAEIRDYIVNSNAELFGISSLFTPYHGEAIEIARIIKDCKPESIVIMGGSHVTCDPEGVLKDPEVDYIILGEGERRLPLLLEKINNNKKNEIKEIDGIGYREGSNKIINPAKTFINDLDSLPYPAIEFCNDVDSKTKKERSAEIITSRGCPHKCAYCSAHISMGNFFRPRSPEAVVDEMKSNFEKYGISKFDIEDDNFTFDKPRAKKMLSLIIDTFGADKLRLSAMNGVSFASLDRELLVLMKKAGFDTINISYVSTDVNTRERMNRPHPSVDFDRIVEEANLEELRVIAYGIFGMPGQTIEEMTETAIYLMGRSVLIGPSIYYPTPGTSLFEKCRREGLLPADQSQWRSTAFPVETCEFSRLDVVTLMRIVRMINFIKDKLGGEFGNGMLLGEIIQLIKENTDDLNSDSFPNNTDIWKKLFIKFFDNKSFYCIKKNKNNEPGMTAEKLPASWKVADYFCKNSLDKPVRKFRL